MKKKIEEFYQIYDYDKKNESICVIEDFFVNNDEEAKKYLKKYYSNENFYLRKVEIIKNYINILGEK